jgi:cob(I)alamin adenosyltransferase
MPIYTRTGDKGKTSLFDGKRVLKSDRRVEAYGTIDELNSMIGLVVAHLTASQIDLKKLAEELRIIQHDLFDAGALLANPAKTLLVTDELEKRFVAQIAGFETRIDEMTEALPTLKNFILPGGGQAGATLHVARTWCRKAERKMVALAQKEEVDAFLIRYFNRLSDLLFTMARFVNYKQKKKETMWKK